MHHLGLVVRWVLSTVLVRGNDKTPTCTSSTSPISLQREVMFPLLAAAGRGLNLTTFPPSPPPTTLSLSTFSITILTLSLTPPSLNLSSLCFSLLLSVQGVPLKSTPPKFSKCPNSKIREKELEYDMV